VVNIHKRMSDLLRYVEDIHRTMITVVVVYVTSEENIIYY